MCVVDSLFPAAGATPLQVPSSPSSKLKAPTSTVQTMVPTTATVADGWIHISQQGNGTFSAFETGAALVKGCEGVMTRTMNNKRSRFYDGHPQHDPELSRRDKVLNARQFCTARIIVDGPVDRNRIKEEDVEYIGKWKLVHGAVECPPSDPWHLAQPMRDLS